MRIIAVTQQKGGVGKTTSVANLAAAFARRGLRVLAVDVDPQGSLSLSLGVDPVEVTATIADAMLHGAPVPVQPTQVPGLDLCPATRVLADAEFDLFKKLGRERFLARVLEGFKGVGYDFVLLDTPPSLGLLTVNCIVAAHRLFVPVSPALLGAAGLRDLLTTVEEIRTGITPQVSIGGVFVTFADRTVAARRAEQELRDDLGEMVLRTAITRRVTHEYAAQAGVPAVVLEPNSVAAAEYTALAEEVLARVHDRPAT